MDLYPGLTTFITAQSASLKGHPHTIYSVHIMYESSQGHILPLKPPEPRPIAVQRKSTHILRPLEDLAGYVTYNRNYDPDEILGRMKEIGRAISQNILSPEECFCRCHGGSLPQTINIYTDQQDLPWEMTWVHNDFLARHVVHARLPYVTPPRSDPIHSTVPRFAVLIGQAAILPFAQQELSEIRDLYRKAFNQDITIFEGPQVTIDLIRDLLATTGNFDRPFDIIHFIGHGDSAMGQTWLELMNSLFLDEYVPTILGGNPLVFFNACFSGTATKKIYRYQADVIDSFGAKLLSGGATHFIGPLIPIRDTTAKRLAISFYSRLFSGEPVGVALYNAKAELGKLDPLAYMYVLYGIPSMKIVEKQSNPERSEGRDGNA